MGSSVAYPPPSPVQNIAEYDAIVDYTVSGDQGIVIPRTPVRISTALPMLQCNHG